jgi:hypothetical protein
MHSQRLGSLDPAYTPDRQISRDDRGQRSSRSAMDAHEQERTEHRLFLVQQSEWSSGCEQIASVL